MKDKRFVYIILSIILLFAISFAVTRIRLNNDKEELNWTDFENEVYITIESFENSDKSNRKELIETFISYSDKVDGAIAEGYCAFAYDYAFNNTGDLFSVLTIKDTAIIDKWAEIASMELSLVLYNTEQPGLLNEIKNNFQEKFNTLPANKKQLGNFYLKRLINYSSL